MNNVILKQLLNEYEQTRLQNIKDLDEAYQNMVNPDTEEAEESTSDTAETDTESETTEEK